MLVVVVVVLVVVVVVVEVIVLRLSKLLSGAGRTVKESRTNTTHMYSSLR
jgi:hypothetical protein